MEPQVARPGEIVDAWSTWTDGETKAVVLRTRHMEMLRLHLNSGVRIPTHEAHGEVVILCVGGRVAVTALNQRHELSGGQMLYLLVHEPFELHGIEEASLLITMLRPLEDGEMIGERH